MITTYLQTRYKTPVNTDFESLSIDLIVGSFDVLACAVTRKESNDNIFALKSFLINKVPVLISSNSILGPLYPVERAEFIIQQALSRIDNSIFPSPSFGMMAENVLQDVRQEFLFSCVLHHLLRAQNVEALLGEAPLEQAPDPQRRYVREDLINQCTVDSEKISQLIEELDKLSGNAGPICLAIAEVRFRHVPISGITAHSAGHASTLRE